MLRLLIKATAWMSFGLLVGRFTGFLRESLIAYRFGVTEKADIAVLLLTVPDLLMNLLIGGALSAVLIPEFKRLKSTQSWALFVQASCFVAVVSTLFIFIMSIYVTEFIHLIAPGISIPVLQKSQNIFRIVLWVTPLTFLAGISTAYLQARENFFITAFSTFIFNLVVVIGVILFIHNTTSLYFLSVFIILGGFFRWFSQIFYVIQYSSGLNVIQKCWLNRKLLIRYLHVLASGSLILFLPYIARALASYAGVGGIATFNYALKLVELPLGVCITIFSIVLFPKLAECFSENNDISHGNNILIHGVRIVTLLSIILMISLIYFSHDLAKFVFGRGTMNTNSIFEISALSAVGFLSLLPQGISSLAIATFNAKRDTFTPFTISLLAVLIFTPFVYFSRNLLGLFGLMCAISLLYFCVMIAQITMLKKIHKISLWGTLVNLKNLRSITIIFLFFIPIMLFTHFFHTNTLTNIIFAAFSVLALIGGMIWIEPEYRLIVINLIRRHPTDSI